MKCITIVTTIFTLIGLQLAGCASTTATTSEQGYKLSDIARLGLREDMSRSEVIKTLGEPTSTTRNHKDNARQDIYLRLEFSKKEMHILKYKNDLLQSVSSSRK